MFNLSATYYCCHLNHSYLNVAAVKKLSRVDVHMMFVNVVTIVLCT